MPSNTVSALLTHQFDHNWDASVAYYQTSEATLLGDGDPVDLIRKCDIRLARKFNNGKWHGEVSAVIENLFNDDYEEFADYNTSKRRARVNLKLNF
jgi:iron complex outermembrane receptor protein